MTEDKRKILSELKYEYVRLYEIAKRMGNKNPNENFLIKRYINDIKELEQELEK